MMDESTVIWEINFSWAVEEQQIFCTFDPNGQLNLIRPDMVADFIPVDTCINLMVAVAWRTAVNPMNPIPVNSYFRSEIENF